MLTRWTAESEKEQLLALQAAQVLDAQAGGYFDRLTRLASRVFGVPIAIITVVDEHRQWFKSAVGIDMPGTPRTDAFCDHTIRQAGVMVIADATQDRRFSDNPLVTGAPHIRFYAGAPLVLASGHALGSLCIIDTVPRDFGPQERQQLLELADLVQAQIRQLLSAGKIDEVTGLFNRTQLSVDLRNLCTLDPGGRRNLVLMEVLGHSSMLEMAHALGLMHVEQLLRDIAAAVVGMTGRRATVYHVELARFAWVIKAGREKDEQALILQLLEHLRRPIDSTGLRFELQPRVGIVTFDLTAPEVEDVVRKAMVSARQAHHSEHFFHRYEAREDNLQQRSYRLLRDFGAGLDAGQLRLVYQPKFNNRRFRCESVEALVRWQHPELGEVPPAEFIALVESTPMIHALTRFVLQSALSQMAVWRSQAVDLQVAVNVSPRDLEDPDFADYVRQMCDAHQVPVHALVIECTESDVLTGAGTVQALQALRAHGVQVALDDFGAAYSNLASLKSLPAEILKIDRSMVWDIDANHRALSVLRAILLMAGELGYRLVAEGVDKAEVFDLLVAMGFDEIQGYYFSRPLEAHAIADFVRATNLHSRADPA